MPRLQARTFDSDGATHEFTHGLAQFVTIGDATVARGVYEPGWRWVGTTFLSART